MDKIEKIDVRENISPETLEYKVNEVIDAINELINFKTSSLEALRELVKLAKEKAPKIEKAIQMAESWERVIDYAKKEVR